MRALVLVLAGGALVGAFFLGRLTDPSAAAAAKTSARGGHVFTAHFRDLVHIPGIHTKCVVSEEAGVPNMLCDHSPRARYEVVLSGDELSVYKNGNPDNPRFSVPWKP
jgi:hypothetical protein